ncbi:MULTISPECIES: VOC family protein [unclassified Streptomyces]|uniref:VOC family protein n=1 Tax=unclassified Streptomyces TaxID=2593676 RepID=UPI002E79E6EE|nr:VOC family protein [Streptomyces sp. JV176]MEE1800900.1 VOC family protein [Streptomyces sp. JV176]
MARDLRAAQEFYGAVLGWTFHHTDLGDAFSVALSGGRAVGGIGALAPSLQAAVAWTPYFAVDDADTAAARIRERGATVAVGPLAMSTGRATLAADPDGAVFGFWEGRTVVGWSVGRGAGPARLELRTRDAFAAAIFYAQVLTWGSDERPSCEVHYENDQVLVRDGTHTVAALRGGAVESAPDPQIRPRWHVYFRVADVADAAAAAAAAGGGVVAPPAVSDSGHEATLRDPDGGLFTVVA